MTEVHGTQASVTLLSDPSSIMFAQASACVAQGTGSPWSSTPTRGCSRGPRCWGVSTGAGLRPRGHCQKRAHAATPGQRPAGFPRTHLVAEQAAAAQPPGHGAPGHLDLRGGQGLRPDPRWRCCGLCSGHQGKRVSAPAARSPTAATGNPLPTPRPTPRGQLRDRPVGLRAELVDDPYLPPRRTPWSQG